MLDVPTSSCPFLTYQTCRFPPPRSWPVARKSISTVHSECANGFSAHTPPRWFPGAGGVRMTLLERISGGFGFPIKWKLGIARSEGEILMTRWWVRVQNKLRKIHTCHCDRNSDHCWDNWLAQQQTRAMQGGCWRNPLLQSNPRYDQSLNPNWELLFIRDL